MEDPTTAMLFPRYDPMLCSRERWDFAYSEVGTNICWSPEFVEYVCLHWPRTLCERIEYYKVHVFRQLSVICALREFLIIGAYIPNPILSRAIDAHGPQGFQYSVPIYLLDEMEGQLALRDGDTDPHYSWDKAYVKAANPKLSRRMADVYAYWLEVNSTN